MKTLREFYQEHQGKVSDKWSLYLDEYDRVFQPYRDQPVRLLEIGIQNGGSLEIWSQYFPRAEALVGCDINEKCKALEYGDDRISVIVENANNDSAEQAILAESPTFDIIIDDGSHTSGDIVHSFSRYFPHLNEGGVFVAEDLHCSYWQEFGGGLFDPYSSISFFKHLADLVNFEHWGVDKDRSELLDLFADKYQVRFEEAQLGSIHSVEFINSMCVIKKCATEANTLGQRHIKGVDAYVVELQEAFSNSFITTSIRPDQHGNPLSNTVLHPAQELDLLRLDLAKAKDDLAIAAKQIAKSEELLRERNSQVAAIESELSEKKSIISDLLLSTSWKVTAPLRLMMMLLRKPVRVIRLCFSAVTLAGGAGPAFAKARRLWKENGFQGLLRGYHYVATRSTNSGHLGRNNYAEWVRQYDSYSESDLLKIKDEIDQWDEKPLISIVMPVYNPNLEWFRQAVSSVMDQPYGNWELCIADDKSTNPGIHDFLKKLRAEDPRVKVFLRETNGHISKASNSALSMAEGDWIALMDQDDLLAKTALYWVARSIRENPDGKLFYSDEDKVDEVGVRSRPYFKCDWNKYLFYSHNLITHLGVYSADIVTEIGGFRGGVDGAQDYDLALRFIERVPESSIVHIPRILYHWRSHENSTASGIEAKSYAIAAGQKAISDHFERVGISATVLPADCGYRVKYCLPEIPPSVSIIVPTRNGLEFLKPCIESIYEKTDYDNYEIIIVDNGSDDAQCIEYLKSLEAASNRVRVLRDDRPFNYSSLNNYAVGHAKGDILLLLNNDVEVIEKDWLGEMVSIACQPDVGAVGAKLLYSDETIQHAGVVLGLGSAAGHVHQHFHRNDPGYSGRLSLINQYSAVTAACLAVRKESYEKVEGLDEREFAVAYNDVDFCLKLADCGLKNVYTPYAVLFHHESKSRGYEDTPEKVKRFENEKSALQRKWLKYIDYDPCYNPNLTADHGDFSLGWPPRVKNR